MRASETTTATLSSTERDIPNHRRRHISLNLNWSDLKDVQFYTSTERSFLFKANYDEKPVVIKIVNPLFQHNEKYVNEIETEMKILSMLDHPHIVKLYGAGVMEDKRRFIVLEDLDGGTLKDRISNGRPKQNSWRIYKRTDKKMRMNSSLSDVYAIAKALEYCHSGIDRSMILHRDLKPDNIGYTSDGTLKLMDFGLAKLIIDNDGTLTCSNDVYHLSGLTGSLRYMAPEVANSTPYNHKVDVYSFGILLWEILSYKTFCEGFDVNDFFEQVICGGMRPDFIANIQWPTDLNDLMRKCWNVNIEARPSFKDIVDSLESIISVRTIAHATATTSKRKFLKNMIIKTSVARPA